MISVYAIINKNNRKIYVGSSISTNKRWNGHKHRLRNGNHHSIHLQRAWNIDGDDSFDFIILEELSSMEILKEKEQYWMDYYQSYDPSFGYNIARKAEHSRIGIIQPKEIKEKISNSLKLYYQNDEYGDSRKTEISNKMKEVTRGSKNPKAKLTEEDVLQIKNLSRKGLSKRSLAEMFDISISTISHIRCGRKWSHVKLES